MKKLLLMFMLLFLSGGMLFANNAQFSTNTSINIVEEEEEEDDDHDEEDDHDEDEHEEEIQLNEEEFKKFVDEHFGFAKKLFDSTEEDELEEFFAELEEVYVDYLRNRDEKAAELMLKLEVMEIQSHLMAELIRQTKDTEEKKSLTQKLSSHLDVLFELKLKVYHIEIEELKAEIQEMTNVIEKRKRLKGKIIEMQLLKLTDGDDVLEW